MASDPHIAQVLAQFLGIGRACQASALPATRTFSGLRVHARA
jgi:hypothetical protein